MDNVTEESRRYLGTGTSKNLSYTVIYPTKKKAAPLFLHRYGRLDMETHRRLASQGIFCAAIDSGDQWWSCGYTLQNYRDGINEILKRFSDRTDRDNITILGVGWEGGVAYAMAVRFPYLFSACISIAGVADYGYDDNASWCIMTRKYNPECGVWAYIHQQIGPREEYRNTRYLVRNAIFGVRNNPYTHFEILHDVDEGLTKPGVQVEQSRRFAAELRRLGYTNFIYRETPRGGLIYAKEPGISARYWNEPIRYHLSFFEKANAAFYHFERHYLVPGILKAAWQKPPFKMESAVFIPAFLETPYFRFDLGFREGNCDEAANLKYRLEGKRCYTFEIKGCTPITRIVMRLALLKPNTMYAVRCRAAKPAQQEIRTDSDGRLAWEISKPAGKSWKITVAAV